MSAEAEAAFGALVDWQKLDTDQLGWVTHKLMCWGFSVHLFGPVGARLPVMHLSSDELLADIVVIPLNDTALEALWDGCKLARSAESMAIRVTGLDVGLR